MRTETKNQRRVVAGLLGALERQNRERFIIQFNVRPYVPGTRWVWPILFASRPIAEKMLQLLPVFSNMDATPERGEIISFTIEKVMLKPRRV